MYNSFWYLKNKLFKFKIYNLMIENDYSLD